jgi:hypothetical protein
MSPENEFGEVQKLLQKTLSELKQTNDPATRRKLLADMRKLLAEADRLTAELETRRKSEDKDRAKREKP